VRSFNSFKTIQNFFFMMKRIPKTT